MVVLERRVAGFHEKAPAQHEDLTGTTPIALALSFTSAAAAAGFLEVLFDRIAAPAAAGALGPSAAGVKAMLASVGRLTVSTTAVLVLLALLAWSVYAWRWNRWLALAGTGVMVLTVSAGLFSVRPILVLTHVAVVLGVVAALAVRWRGVSMTYIGALWAIALAIVAGQWSLSGLIGGSTLAPRAIGEAALVLALVLLAVGAFSSSHRGLGSLVGLAAGAGLGAVSLASDFTPFVALMATGAMMWLPSLAYIVAAGAVGYVLATWLPHPSTRHRAAGLVLLAVAGIYPSLVHHSATALLALVVLAVPWARQGALSWR